jgi:hypothetical protein
MKITDKALNKKKTTTLSGLAPITQEALQKGERRPESKFNTLEKLPSSTHKNANQLAHRFRIPTGPNGKLRNPRVPSIDGKLLSDIDPLQRPGAGSEPSFSTGGPLEGILPDPSVTPVTDVATSLPGVKSPSTDNGDNTTTTPPTPPTSTPNPATDSAMSMYERAKMDIANQGAASLRNSILSNNDRNNGFLDSTGRNILNANARLESQGATTKALNDLSLNFEDRRLQEYIANQNNATANKQIDQNSYQYQNSFDQKKKEYDWSKEQYNLNGASSGKDDSNSSSGGKDDSNFSSGSDVTSNVPATDAAIDAPLKSGTPTPVSGGKGGSFLGSGADRRTPEEKKMQTFGGVRSNIENSRQSYNKFKDFDAFIQNYLLNSDQTFRDDYAILTPDLIGQLERAFNHKKKRGNK